MKSSARPGSRRHRWERRLGSVVLVLCLAACGAAEPPEDESAAPPGPSGIAEDGATAPARPSGIAEGGSTAPPPSPQPPPLTAQGWGALRIGMTRAAVVAAAGEDANPAAVGGPEPEACDEFHPQRAPEGMRVMIERDRLTRITLSEGASVRTERGFGVGDPAGPVEQAYGDSAAVSPHKYSPAPAAYITVWTTPPGGSADARGIVYEIGTDGRVAHIHAGGASIQYVEGCL